MWVSGDVKKVFSEKICSHNGLADAKLHLKLLSIYYEWIKYIKIIAQKNGAVVNAAYIFLFIFPSSTLP